MGSPRCGSRHAVGSVCGLPMGHEGGHQDRTFDAPNLVEWEQDPIHEYSDAVHNGTWGLQGKHGAKTADIIERNMREPR